MRTNLLKFRIAPLVFVYTTQVFATDWSSQATLPGETRCQIIHEKEICLADGNRKNILDLPKAQWQEMIKRGSKHALSYPVEITRLQLPKDSMDKFFNSDSQSPLRRFVFNIAKKLTQFKSFEDIFEWLGMNTFPETINEVGPNYIADMEGFERKAMGVTTYDHNGYQGVSISCAECHSSNLFGVRVMGMTNRFPRANEAFLLGKNVLSKTPALAFKVMVGPSDEDYKMFKEAKKAMSFVRVKKPLTLGLDTSLAQVGLSLANRREDQYASLKPTRRRISGLDKSPADSKPAVWWNLKYKTKWLSDASIRSGNPVHTNFLWNEIGRGQDLKNLEDWFKTNKKKVDELTAYVFNTEPPKYNKFFPSAIDIEKAKRGEKLFLANCMGCHGQYQKGWDNHLNQDYQDQIATTKVFYHSKTIVKDVGTDPYRREGMQYFAEDLNRLKISKEIGTIVKEQKGYVPPPLVGIWARYPYFHNNSVPTLYDVLTPDFKRPTHYIATPAENKNLDFDQEKNGYPSPDMIRPEIRNDSDYHFDTRTKGLSNQGHTKMMLNEMGQEKFNHEEKLELIEFLKTL